MNDADETQICRRCSRPVATPDYKTFEQMHYVCFHYEFEHGDVDIDQECAAGGCPSRPHGDTPAPKASYEPGQFARMGVVFFETWTLAANDLEVKVKVQFARRPEWQAIPIVIERVQLRYSDLTPSVDLGVPTPSGFAAMKLIAWFDHRTPRDLFDLGALADAGHIDEAASQLLRSIAGYTPGTGTLERTVPRSVASSWQTELGHQASDLASPGDCLARVRAALDRIGE